MMADIKIAGAPTVEVLYMCEGKHVTPVVFHAQVKDFPKQWDCKVCHKNAKYVASSHIPTDEYVPDPKKLSSELREPTDAEIDEAAGESFTNRGNFTFGHLQALRERRSQEELESLLKERLEILRGSSIRH